MRTSYSSGSQRASVDSMMTPMIDVVFLLLVFFLATSSFQQLEKELPSAAASAPEKEQQGVGTDANSTKVLTDLSDMVVKIQSSKKELQPDSVSYQFNGEPMNSLEQLTDRMKRLIRLRSDVPIVIDPNDDVPAGEAIRVYDIARSNGSTAVFLVAR